jgi:hypothetical protein
MRKAFWLLFLVLAVGLAVSPAHGSNPQPTIYFQGWIAPSTRDYGQGISYIEVYDNSTGSFKLQENVTNSENGCGVNASCSVQLIIGYVANHTLLYWSYADNSTGRNFLRFNVSVVHNNGTEIFTQQNGTYVSNRYIGNDLFVFEHSIVLNFETEYSTVYDVTIQYDY